MVETFPISLTQKEAGDQNNAGTVRVVMALKSIDESQLRLRWQKLIDVHEILRSECSLNKNFNHFTLQIQSELHEQIKLIEHDQTMSLADLSQGQGPSLGDEVKQQAYELTLHKTPEELFLEAHFNKLFFDPFSMVAVLRFLSEPQLDDALLSTPEITYTHYSKWLEELQTDEEVMAEVMSDERLMTADLPGNLNIPYQSKPGCGSKMAVYQEPIRLSMPPRHTTNQQQVESILLATMACTFQPFVEGEKLLIGMRISGRKYEQLNQTLGLVDRVIPIGVKLRANVESITALLEDVKEAQEYLFSKGNASIQREIVFEYIDQSDLESQVLYTDTDDAHHWKLLVIKKGDDYECHWSCPNHDYDKQLMSLMTSRFEAVFQKLVQADARKAPPQNTITEVEQSMLDGFADGEITENNLLFSDSFGKIAKTHASETAILYDGQSLNYAQLVSKTDQIGQYTLATLQKNAPGKSDYIVAVRLSSYLDAVTVFLAGLRYGFATMPLDVRNPENRIAFMLQDSAADIFIHDFPHDIEYPAVKTFSWAALKEQSNNSYGLKVPSSKPNDLAYVLYTSGSTGRPKGVMISHGNLMNYLNWANGYYFSEGRHHFAVVSPFSFDLSITGIFSTLLRGDTLCLFDPAQPDKAINEAMSNERVNTIKITPSHIILLNSLGARADHINKVIVGGEKLTNEHVVQLQAALGTSVEIYNEYGPTECTVGCSVAAIADAHEKITIGRPIDNVKLLILNEHCQEVSVGVYGELYVGGESVALGYTDEALTAHKFVNIDGRDGRFYKTGDAARWLLTGNLELAGRIDSQVKINGILIEPREIEASFTKHFSTNVAAFTVKQAHGNYLALAYEAETPLDSETITQALAKDLPEFMVPVRFVQQKKIPLTNNGKVDTSLLTEKLLAAKKTEPKVRDAFDAKVLKLIEGVLAVTELSIEDHFLKVGGHSISAVKIITQIKKHLQIDISLKEFFENLQLKDLIDLLRERNGTELKAAEILPIEKQPFYPASKSQSRLWILDQFEENTLNYNVAGSYVLEGDMDVERIRWAYARLIERHEILRTTFTRIDNNVVQQVLEDGELDFEVFELPNLMDDWHSEVELKVKQYVAHKFDLAEKPPCKAIVTKVNENKMVFTWVLHHIICDGWSLEVLYRDFMTIYGAYPDGKIELPDLNIQYRDYANWQNNYLSSPEFESSKERLLDKFTEAPRLDLPTPKNRPAVLTNRGKSLDTLFGKKDFARLQAYASESNVSVFMLLMTCVNVILYRYSGQRNMVMGTTVAGRQNGKLENQVGFYVNTVPMRFDLNGIEAFDDALVAVKDECLESFSLEEYPFDELVKELNLSRELNRNPLFDILVSYNNTEFNENATIDVDGLQLSAFQVDSGISQFDLTFRFNEFDGQLVLNLEYSLDLFDDQWAHQFHNHLLNLIETVVTSSGNDISISGVSFLSEGEIEKVIHQFNDTAADYPTHETLVTLFEKAAKQHPDKSFLYTEDKCFTLGELNIMANRLADKLVNEHGIAIEDVVAMMLPKNEWMIVAILGILKAGAAYLPIDIENPASRVNGILEDARTKLLLLDEAWREDKHNEFTVCPMLHVEELVSGTGHDENLNVEIEPGNLAYIIYTSGSTGKPKGVMIEHQAVVNRIDWMYKHYQITPEDVILQKTPYVFDVSVWELFIPLCFGSTMVLCPKEKSYNVEQICDLIARHKVTMLHFVPSMLNIFLSEMKPLLKQQLVSLKRVITSGEALQVESAKKLYDFLDVELHNLYGPTEATVDVTYHHVAKEPMRIPIGAPIHNTSVFILDQQLNPVPIGVTGDIYLSGDGLARGYIHNPELTAEKFVDNPFDVGSNKMYKTGDSGQWDANGEVLFKGRTDFQVKLRGYRIELGDIESQMINFEGVRNAVAVIKSPTKDTQLLVGYVDGIEAGQISDLKEFLKEQLPEYMVPTFIVSVAAFVFTATGKINRKVLPDYRSHAVASEDIDMLPQNEREAKIMQMWKDILGLEFVGRQQNFFDLGGNSINATQLLTRMNEEFELALKLGVIFKFETIEELARHVEKLPKKAYQEIKIRAPQDSYPVSFAQRRVWLAQQIETTSPAYNINMVYRISGAEVHYHFLEESMKSLIRRHELFRIKISNIEGELRYRVMDPDTEEFQLRYRELQEDEDAEQIIQEIAFEEAMVPFDLENKIPIRAMLVKLGEKDQLLCINYHHIISDGWSNDLIVNEIIIKYFALLNGEMADLPEVKVKYSDYVAWYMDYLDSPEALIDKKYWHGKMSQAPKQKDLPFSQARPAIMTSNGHSLAFLSSPQETDQLRVLAKQSRATLFHLMTALTSLLIHKYTDETDIVFGSNSINRMHKDLELSIGMYLDIILIRNTFTGNHTFADLVKIAKSTVVEAQDHQRYPLDLIMDDLGFKRDISKTPLFNYFVLFQNFSDRMINEKLQVGENEFTGKMKNVPIQLPTGKFDLSFIYQEIGDRLSVKINFNVNLFNKADVLDMATRFRTLLLQVLDNPDLPISEYSLFEKEEQDNLTRINKTAYANEQLIARIEKHCEQHGDDIAAIYAGYPVTYHALARHSNYVADHIRSKNPNNRPVPVLLNDGLEYAVALVAILKLGGTIVPINAHWPVERVNGLLQELEPDVVLCHEDYRDKLSHFGFEIITQYDGTKDHFEWVPYDEQGVPYIIYTSGTSGKPKGVKGSYKGLLNRLQWMDEYFGVDSAKSVLQSTRNIYDSSLWQILWPLINGGKTVIPIEARKIDVGYLQHEISKNEVTLVDFVPSLFNELVVEGLTAETSWLDSVRDVIFGGEAISVPHVIKFKEQFPEIRITNLYGPTEASIGCIYYPVTGKESGAIPIGKPISNVGVLIMKNNQLAATNIPGEILLYGDCLSHGYFKDREKTDQNFFTVNAYGKEILVYRTGDLGKFNVRGDIDFLGRADRQVKVNGLRIELGEIESHLLKIEELKEAVVAVKRIQERNTLIAYYTSDESLDEKYIRNQLKNKLPANIIPQHFMLLDRIPITEAGKLDSAALPMPGLKKRTKVVDRSELDEVTLRLIHIWEDKMSLEDISPEDDFFDLGGNSLQALRILNTMQLDFGIQVQLRHLFEHTNVQAMSSIISQMIEESGISEPFKADIDAV